MVFFCISAEVPRTVEEIILFLFSNVYMANTQCHKRVNYRFFMLHHLSLIIIYSCYVLTQENRNNNNHQMEYSHPLQNCSITTSV